MAVSEMQVFREIITKELSAYDSDIVSIHQKMQNKAGASVLVRMIVFFLIAVVFFAGGSAGIGLIIIVFGIVSALKNSSSSEDPAVFREKLVGEIYRTMGQNPTMDVREATKYVIENLRRN